ncbi:MAG: TetR/AcrR family transcriptional regulator [Acholeplasma sp.]|nr:TetR/AcrR family transcriptional regulator [Acholeplasma sp.]
MKNQELKKRIIAETRSLLQSRKTVTIKDIAEKCYINIASVNYHFGSKDTLIQLVATEVIEELKERITDILKANKDKPKVELIEEMIKFTYSYALENIGLLYYLFINQDAQQSSSNLLIDTFFTDNAFTRMIFNEIKLANANQDKTTIFARYMIMFSSFCMPLFISITNQDSDSQIETFKDEAFTSVFIKELLRIIDTNDEVKS